MNDDMWTMQVDDDRVPPDVYLIVAFIFGATACFCMWMLLTVDCWWPVIPMIYTLRFFYRACCEGRDELDRRSR